MPSSADHTYKQKHPKPNCRPGDEITDESDHAIDISYFSTKSLVIYAQVVYPKLHCTVFNKLFV